jgi:hypothetical protein
MARERELPEYLIAARAYCRARFAYYPHSHHGGVSGAAAALEHDAAGIARTPWFRAVVDASVVSAVARMRETRRDVRRSARRARFSWLLGAPEADAREPSSRVRSRARGDG